MQGEKKADSIIGENSFFKGRYAVRGSLRIDGRFEGESLLVDQLMIGQSAKVKSNIHSTSVVVEGIVIGNISATSRVLLLATARVLGDIKTPELIIQDGVILEGRCTISRHEMANTRQYIEELFRQGQEGKIRE